MTQSFNLDATESTGTISLSRLDFGVVASNSATNTATIRIYNLGTAAITTATLNACRADLMIDAPIDEEEYYGNRGGEELVNEKWCEARISGDLTWVPLDENTAALTLGSLAVSAYITVELRVSVVSAATSLGDIDFALKVSAT